MSLLVDDLEALEDGRHLGIELEADRRQVAAEVALVLAEPALAGLVARALVPGELVVTDDGGPTRT